MSKHIAQWVLEKHLGRLKLRTAGLFDPEFQSPRLATTTAAVTGIALSAAPGHHALPVIEIHVNKVRVIDVERVVAGAQLDEPLSGLPWKNRN